MPCQAEISRTNPGCFLFVIDQSGSMVDKMPNGKSKASGVSDALNRFLQNLVIKCSKSEGVRDYFYVGVIGYGQNGEVKTVLEGALRDKELVPISELAMNPLEIQERDQQVDDGAGGLVTQHVKFPIWVNPIADATTPMKSAFLAVNGIVENWIRQNPNSFSPIIVHITDGESTDGDPSPEMNRLTSQKSSENCPPILFNLHLSSSGHPHVTMFPSSDVALPDDYAKMLFHGASELTPAMASLAKEEYGIDATAGARGFVFNGDMASIIKALDIGTRPNNLK